MASICTAAGWFVEYEDGEVLRVAFFYSDRHGNPLAYVSYKGRFTWAENAGKISSIWHIHDEH